MESMKSKVAWMAVVVLVGVSMVEGKERGGEIITRRFMTYNVECSACNLRYPWAQRLQAFQDIFERNQPDLLGTQELTFASEVEDFLEILPGNMSAIYFQGGRNDPDAAIFYNTDIFQPISDGFFWLGPTPDVPFSKGFVTLSTPRLWTWAHFLDMETQREFVFTSTHFDNNSPNQEKSAPLVLERTAGWNALLPVVTVGDFNSDWESTAYGILTKGRAPYVGSFKFHYQQTYTLAWDVVIESNQTTPPAYDETQAIDHIFVGSEREYTVPYWAVDMHTYKNGQYPSDHFPLIADIQLPEVAI